MGAETFLPLRKFTTPEFVLGTGASALVGAYAAKFGASKVLLVSDTGVMAAGHVDTVIASLRSTGLSCKIFSGVSPNPRDVEVRSGLDLYRSSNCDVIVAVGGGSVMDCAKCVGLMSANLDKDVLDFEGVDSVVLPGPPLICVPTTAGTAADISQFAIINATERRTKITVVSKKAIPDAALIDPDLTVSMPVNLTAATGMDVLSHAIEAYVSTASSVVTDLHAIQAIGLVGKYLPRAVRDGEDKEARNNMVLASLLAGLAFSNAGLGAVHALAHSLGGHLDLPHGLCNALLLVSVCDFNFDSVAPRYAKIFEILSSSMPASFDAAASGAKERDSVRDMLRALLLHLRGEVGLSGGLATRGLQADEIPIIAKKAYLDACMATNPRKPTLREVHDLFERSL